MNKIKRLIQSYSKYIAIPWRSDAAPAQRVIFCVYGEEDELRLRYGIDEFEIETKKSGYEWALFDLTGTFARWLATQTYAESYFRKPQLLPTLLPKYPEFIASEFSAFLRSAGAAEGAVVALMGVGSLFGLARVRELVDILAPMVQGRLLVFFPGSFENNNYRLLDGYDGWNYLAVPITADNEY
ncbi:MAG: DUF1788 domain-containing protein [Bacteroidetes bacterium]|nr:DUF1788 domain-containing protein [Bacteroidota bacterium]